MEETKGNQKIPSTVVSNAGAILAHFRWGSAANDPTLKTVKRFVERVEEKKPRRKKKRADESPPPPPPTKKRRSATGRVV